MSDASTPPPSASSPRPLARGTHRLCARLPQAAVLWSGGRIRHINAGARALLGCGGGDADLQALHALLAVLPRRGAPAQPADLPLLCPDGALRVLRVSAMPQPRRGPRARIWLLHDTTADSHALDRLQQAHDQLARLSAAVDAAQQQRRRQAAQRVHDELLQSLVAIRMQLDAAAHAAAGPCPDTAQALQRSIGIAHAALASGRDIVRALGSPMLVELGLAASLEALAADFARRHHTPCSVRARGVDGPGLPAPDAAVQCLYRVAEEALANVAQHALARQVRLRLAGDRQGGLSLRISDDGVGLATDGAPNPQTIGLPVLLQRVRALGGRLVVHSVPGGGTTITARLPTAGRQRRAPEPRRDTPEAVLTRFFYRAPVGLVQADLDGRIELLNPLAACCLLPFSPDGGLDNLFAVLATAAPQLALRAAALQAADGVLCEGLLIRQGKARPVWLTVTKQAGTRWMAVLGEMPPPQPAAAAAPAAPARVHGPLA